MFSFCVFTTRNDRSIPDHGKVNNSELFVSAALVVEDLSGASDKRAGIWRTVMLNSQCGSLIRGPSPIT